MQPVVQVVNDEYLESLPILSKLSKQKRQEIYKGYGERGQFYAIEPVPRGGKGKSAKCRFCNKQMTKGPGVGESALRIRHLVCTGNRCFKPNNRDSCGRYHLHCFLRDAPVHEAFVKRMQYTNEDWKVVKSPGQLAGFTKLSAEHQAIVNDIISSKN